MTKRSGGRWLRLLALVLAAALALPSAAAAAEPEAPAFYRDVAETDWFYQDLRVIHAAGIAVDGPDFHPMGTATRLELVTSLFRLHKAMGGWVGDFAPQDGFTDVPAGGEAFTATAWARAVGITNGVSPTLFDPDAPLTREQCCTLLVRFANAENILLTKRQEPSLFRDSVRVSDFARSYMVAGYMAGLITGYSDGTVAPQAYVLRCEAAAMLCRLYWAAMIPSQGPEYVYTSSSDYLSCYARYDYTFGQPLPQTDPVGAGWFDNAVFIGDSVTVRLQMYCASTAALGKATFLCTTSLSAPNALASVTAKSLHPTYNGVKQKVEDSVAACGAKNVYIMLGINNMRSSVEVSTASLVKLIGKIKEKSPDVNIFIQSVTPMTATSNILAPDINNVKINQYNARMQTLCAQYGWYYLDVASAFKDSSGNLVTAYCSDPRSMGIHFTSAAAKMWCDYLKTHTPESMREKDLPDSPLRPAGPAPVLPSPLEKARDAMLDYLGAEDPLLLDKTTLCGLYGLDEAWVAGCAGFIVMNGVFPDEIILVETPDDPSAAQVAAALQVKLDTVMDQAQLYDAESYEALQSCAVVADGHYVRLILSPSQYDLAVIYYSQFG